MTNNSFVAEVTFKYIFVYLQITQSTRGISHVEVLMNRKLNSKLNIKPGSDEQKIKFKT